MTEPDAATTVVPRFDFLGKLLQSGLRDRLRAFVDGEDRGPLLVELDPTSACNFSCGNCVSADLLNQGHMPTNDLFAVIDALQNVGVRGVILIGGGEPLAHPAIEEAIKRLGSGGIAIGVTTNGTFITRYIESLCSYVDWVRVSVDAASGSMFDCVRPSRIRNAFDVVQAQISAIAARDARPALGYSFLVQWHPASLDDLARGIGIVRAKGRAWFTNMGEIASGAAVAASLGCDYFEVKPSVDSDHRLIALPPPLRPLLEEELSRARHSAAGRIEVVLGPGIHHLLVSESTDQVKSYAACPSVHLRTLITHEGVFPCPYYRGRADKRVGADVVKSLHDWAATGQRLDDMIDPRSDCGFFCIRHRLNSFLSSCVELKKDEVDLMPYLKETVSGDVFF